ncbi:hypothetical protein [Isobaculum melis]|uniref:Uncharacterized protein n=1 Tax=Isobaculum melis TaxID=142588 RepID=A0A1H9TTD7_9LACT|nr:hypothetical protein [Isobaculum melis]SES00251.1 hypothetical protein SAMN04488559_11616 [Isobaculum melis]
MTTTYDILKDEWHTESSGIKKWRNPLNSFLERNEISIDELIIYLEEK